MNPRRFADWKDREGAEEAVTKQLAALGVTLDLKSLTYDRGYIGCCQFFAALDKALQPLGFRVDQVDTGEDAYEWSIEPLEQV